MNINFCKTCGAPLTQRDEYTWECGYCHNVYSDESVAKESERLLKALLDEQKTEKVANLRRNLYDAVNAEYTDSELICRLCVDLKNLLPDDFMANFYAVANGENEKKTAEYINRIDAKEHAEYIEDVLKFMLKSFSAEYRLPLAGLIERAFRGEDLEKLAHYNTLLSEEAEKADLGVYETKLTRDVFVAYSGKDIEHVYPVVSSLEASGLTCFVAARNLRHGKGAVQNYNTAIKEAIASCKSVVFISTPNSRSFACDALKIELPAIKQTDINNAPYEYKQNYAAMPAKYKKPRVELRIADSKTPNAADTLVKEFFEGCEYAYTAEEVATRIITMLSTPVETTEPTREPAKVKYCISCGTENPASVKFCGKCGGKHFTASKPTAVAKPKTSPPPTKKKEKGGMAVIVIALILVFVTVAMVLPKKDSPAISTEEPVVTEKIPSGGTSADTTSQTAESTSADTSSQPNPTAQLYAEAERLFAEGDYGAAAIAFSKCGGYSDAAARCDESWAKRNYINHNTLYADENMIMYIKEDGTLPTSAAYYPEMLGWTDLVSITYEIGLKSDGTLVLPNESSWDEDFKDIYKEIKSWKDIVSFSLGYGFAIALKKDGTVLAVGDNTYGQCNVGEWKDIVDVKVNIDYSYTIGIKANGSAVMAGGEFSEGDPKFDVSAWKNISHVSKDGFFGIGKDGKISVPFSVDEAYKSFDEETGKIFEYLLSLCDVMNVDTNSGTVVHTDGSIIGFREINYALEDSEYWTNVVSVQYGWYYAVGLRYDGTLVFSGDNQKIPVTEGKSGVLVPNQKEFFEKNKIITTKFDGYSLKLRLRDDGYYEVCGFGGSGDVVIPESYAGRSIVSISPFAFAESDVTSVKIEYVYFREIGAYAFKNCRKLVTLKLPSSGSMQELREGVFYGCESLTSVNLYSMPHIKSIGSYAFYNCFSLKELPVTDIERIGDSAFSGCSALTEIRISASYIGENAFSDCTSVAFIDFNDDAVIAPYAFSGCSALTKVSLPHGMTEIPEGIFSGCTSLKSIFFPNTVIKIGASAFEGCTSLETVNLPTSLVALEERVFFWCDNIKFITIPSTLKNIGSNAFSTYSLEEIVFVGTKAQWNENAYDITKPGAESITVYCMDGNLTVK